jgi:hypothetical protein
MPRLLSLLAFNSTNVQMLTPEDLRLLESDDRTSHLSSASCASSIYLLYCTKVQILTQQKVEKRLAGQAHVATAQFSCFTSAKVQILTQKQVE